MKAMNIMAKRDSLTVLTNPWLWIHFGRTLNARAMSNALRKMTMYLPKKPNKKNKLSVKT